MTAYLNILDSLMASSPSGKAGACKALIAGSIPADASNLCICHAVGVPSSCSGTRPGDGIGRHTGLKIPGPCAVRVQAPPRVLHHFAPRFIPRLTALLNLWKADGQAHPLCSVQAMQAKGSFMLRMAPLETNSEFFASAGLTRARMGLQKVYSGDIGGFALRSRTARICT